MELHYFEGALAPVVLEALLHCHYRIEPLPDTEAMRAAAECLKTHDLIIRFDDRSERVYETTERGKAYVQMLCSLPFPVKRFGWFNPQTGAMLSKD